MTPPELARGLGPHVLGQRVVVRRLVRGETGPSGGPAMTDLLGVCTAWEADACVVQPEHGEAVRIALADVVSGKPVPPRPSVRHRVSVREAEDHALVLWPGVHTEPLGAWLLRTDPQPIGRLLKRANSALAVGDPGVDPALAATRVRAFYEARERDALVQVEHGSEAHRWFERDGWTEVEGGAALFQLASLARALRACGTSRDLTGVRVELDQDGPRAAVEVLVDGEHAAAGQAGLDGDWLGLHSVHVVTAHRRRGLATAVMRELLDWGGAGGARHAWLHVEVDNERALALYDRLGFATHHELRYLRAPAGPDGR